MGNSNENVKKLKNFAAINTNLKTDLDDGVLPTNLGMDNHILLNDPNLVEEFSIITKDKANYEGSASGSVIITPTSNSTPWKLLDAELEKQKLVAVDADENNNDDTNEDSLDITNTYYYSDSDFEDNLEKRLQDMNIANSDDTAQNDMKPSNESGKEHDQSLSEYDYNIQEGNIDSSLLRNEQESYEEMLVDNDDSNVELNDDIQDDDSYEQLPPPKELDPEKLYALYPFDGPDPSHCKLEQDEACILLNDQDAYWWLVKKCTDNKIGFAPAEILETFPERLARLNCWKNENMSAQGIVSDLENSKDDISKKDIADSSENLSVVYKSSDKAKSVSFNNVINYAERIIEEDAVNNYSDGDESDYEEKVEDDTEKIKAHDKFSEGNINDFDDEASEVASDVSFATGSSMPLKVRKTRQDKTREVNTSKRMNSISVEGRYKKADQVTTNTNAFINDEEELHKIFEAPNMPFNNNKIHNSNSDYSISTIGEYSPSSSELTNDSPKVLDNEFSNENSGLPLSKAIQGISGLIDEDKKLHENDSVSTALLEDSNYKEDHDRDNGDEEKDHDNKGNDNEDGNNTSTENESAGLLNRELPGSLKNNNSSTNLSSTDDFYMESERIPSTVSIGSTYSPSKMSPQHKSTELKQHPLIENLYHPIFNRMDALLKLIDDIEHQQE